jgi:hypothetical protein
MTDKREARALWVLRRLEKGAHLELGQDGACVLAGRGPRRPLDPETVALMRARGWLAEREGHLAASEAGLACLARASAEADRFAAQHRVLETKLMKDDRGRECYVVVNAAESPLALLRQRELIDHDMFEAGEKLRRDFTLAQLSPRLAIDYAAPVGRRNLKPEILITEAALAAKQRFNRAMRMLGPGLADVLFDVCCMLRGLEESEAAHNWPRGSANVVLRLALERLAHHYGARRARARVRVWMKEEG